MSVNCTRKQERGKRERYRERMRERERERGSERCSITLSHLLPVSLAQVSQNFTLLSFRFSLALLPFAPWSQCVTFWHAYTHIHTHIHTHTQPHRFFFIFFSFFFFMSSSPHLPSPQRRCRDEIREWNVNASVKLAPAPQEMSAPSATAPRRRRGRETERVRTAWQIHRKGALWCSGNERNMKCCLWAYSFSLWIMFSCDPRVCSCVCVRCVEY